MAMININDVTPARTYANPKRATTAGLNMGGGKNVRVVISKASNGRYFPVLVGRVQQRDDVTGEERPQRQRRARAENARTSRQGARGAAKKAAGGRKSAAKKAVPRTKSNGRGKGRASVH